MIGSVSARIARALAVLLLVSAPAWAAAQGPGESSLPKALFENTPLGEELEVLRPDRPRREQEADRLRAASLFAHGRLLQNREDYAGALQRFERAWRYHGEQVSILDSIVPLAFELGRNGEAARYAVIAAERNPQDSVMLRRLAMFLSQQEDYQRAAALYEKAVRLDDSASEDISQLLIRMELGRLYLLLEEYEKSAAAFAEPAAALASPEKYDLTENFEKALLGKPEQTWRMFGESFVRAGQYERAETMFHKAHAAEANQPLLDFSLARVAAGRNQTEQALERLEAYFQAKATIGGAEPYELFDKLLAESEADEQQRRARVLARLRPLLEDDPTNLALGVYVAGKLADDRKWDDAESIYTDLLAAAPSQEAFSGLIELQHRRGDAPKLLDALGKVAARAGSFEAVEEATAAILQDEKLLEQLLAEAARRQQENPEQLGEGVALAAGLLAIEAEAFDSVGPLMKRALEEGIPEKSAIVSQWGLGLLIAGQSELAAEVFQMAIERKIDEENNAGYYFYLASALGMADQFDEAVAAARKAAELRPTPRFKGRIAWLYYYAKRYDEAVARYRELLKEYGDQYGDAEVRDVVRETRMVLSTIAVRQDRNEEAVELLEQVLDEFPEDIGAFNDLGYLWADQNVHLHRAHAMIARAVAEEPENKAYRDSLGWVLYRLGRIDEAIVELERAADEESPDGVILDHLADAYQAAGRREEARALWRRAIEAFEQEGEHEMEQEVRRKLDPEPG